MDVRHLIDAIVQRTMVLIAQLATSQGDRAPLAHIADEVFLDLITELEQQGVRRKVVADMFGLALRSYQKRVQRVAGGVADAEMSLRDAILGWLQGREAVTRAALLGVRRGQLRHRWRRRCRTSITVIHGPSATLTGERRATDLDFECAIDVVLDTSEAPALGCE